MYGAGYGGGQNYYGSGFFQVPTSPTYSNGVSSFPSRSPRIKQQGASAQSPQQQELARKSAQRPPAHQGNVVTRASPRATPTSVSRVPSIPKPPSPKVQPSNAAKQSPKTESRAQPSTSSSAATENPVQDSTSSVVQPVEPLSASQTQSAQEYGVAEAVALTHMVEEFCQKQSYAMYKFVNETHTKIQQHQDTIKKARARISIVKTLLPTPDPGAVQNRLKAAFGPASPEEPPMTALPRHRVLPYNQPPAFTSLQIPVAPISPRPPEDQTTTDSTDFRDRMSDLMAIRSASSSARTSAPAGIAVYPQTPTPSYPQTPTRTIHSSSHYAAEGGGASPAQTGSARPPPIGMLLHEARGRISVKLLTPGGLAERSGRIREGDEVVEVQGEDMRGRALETVCQRIAAAASSPHPLALALQRPHPSGRGAWHVEVTLAARRPSASSALQSPGRHVYSSPSAQLRSTPGGGQPPLHNTISSNGQDSLGRGYRSEVTVGQSLAERVARDLHMLGSPGPAATGSGSGGQYQLETQTPGRNLHVNREDGRLGPGLSVSASRGAGGGGGGSEDWALKPSSSLYASYGGGGSGTLYASAGGGGGNSILYASAGGGGGNNVLYASGGGAGGGGNVLYASGGGGGTSVLYASGGGTGGGGNKVLYASGGGGGYGVSGSSSSSNVPPSHSNVYAGSGQYAAGGGGGQSSSPAGYEWRGGAEVMDAGRLGHRDPSPRDMAEL